MTRLAVGLVILSVAAVASAAPIIVVTVDEPVAGKYRYSFSVDDPLDEMGAYFVNMTWEPAGEESVCVPGTTLYQDEIYQMPPGAYNPVEDEATAAIWDGYDYEKETDCWIASELWEGNILAYSTVPDPENWPSPNTSIHIEMGSEPAPVAYDVMEIAQIVCDGDLKYSGSVSRKGVTTPLDPTVVCAPEPASLLLVTLGGLGVLLRRKR